MTGTVTSVKHLIHMHMNKAVVQGGGRVFWVKSMLHQPRSFEAYFVVEELALTTTIGWSPDVFLAPGGSYTARDINHFLSLEKWKG